MMHALTVALWIMLAWIVVSVIFGLTAGPLLKRRLRIGR